MVLNPSLPFFPLGKHCYIIFCLDYNRPLKYSRDTLETWNPEMQEYYWSYKRWERKVRKSNRNRDARQ